MQAMLQRAKNIYIHHMRRHSPLRRSGWSGVQPIGRKTVPAVVTWKIKFANQIYFISQAKDQSLFQVNDLYKFSCSDASLFLGSDKTVESLRITTYRGVSDLCSHLIKKARKWIKKVARTTKNDKTIVLVFQNLYFLSYSVISQLLYKMNPNTQEKREQSEDLSLPFSEGLKISITPVTPLFNVFRNRHLLS